MDVTHVPEEPSSFSHASPAALPLHPAVSGGGTSANAVEAVAPEASTQRIRVNFRMTCSQPEASAHGKNRMSLNNSDLKVEALWRGQSRCGTMRKNESNDVLTLSMIVKDEAATIARTLRSVKPFIDRWIILDTGSTDSTSDVVREELPEAQEEVIGLRTSLPGQSFPRLCRPFATNT